MVPEDHNFQRESQILVRPEGGCQVSLNPSNNGFKHISAARRHRHQSSTAFLETTDDRIHKQWSTPLQFTSDRVRFFEMFF